MTFYADSEEFDIASDLEAMMKSNGWRTTVRNADERIEALMDRMVQVDCTDAERNALAGEIRGLRYMRDWPGNEHKHVIDRLLARNT